jgi:hypothetical protein
VFPPGGPTLAFCAGVTLDSANLASFAALLIRLVSAPFNALARLSPSSFSFIFRSWSSRVPSLSVTFFSPFVNASMAELGDIALPTELVVGDCASVDRGAACRKGGAGWRLEVASGETGALAGTVDLADLSGARTFLTGSPPGALAGTGGGCIA